MRNGRFGTSTPSLASDGLDVIPLLGTQDWGVVVLEGELLSAGTDGLGADQSGVFDHLVKVGGTQWKIEGTLAVCGQLPRDSLSRMPSLVEGNRSAKSIDAFRNCFPACIGLLQPLGILALPDLAEVRPGFPSAAQLDDRCCYTNRLGLTLLMRADHDQKRVNQLHRVLLEGLAAVGLSI